MRKSPEANVQFISLQRPLQRVSYFFATGQAPGKIEFDTRNVLFQTYSVLLCVRLVQRITSRILTVRGRLLELSPTFPLLRVTWVTLGEQKGCEHQLMSHLIQRAHLLLTTTTTRQKVTWCFPKSHVGLIRARCCASPHTKEPAFSFIKRDFGESTGDENVLVNSDRS